jgi:hypothetical protein
MGTARVPCIAFRSRVQRITNSGFYIAPILSVPHFSTASSIIPELVYKLGSTNLEQKYRKYEKMAN